MLILNDFKSFVFVSVDVKGVADADFVSVDVKRLSEKEAAADGSGGIDKGSD